MNRRVSSVSRPWSYTTGPALSSGQAPPLIPASARARSRASASISPTACSATAFALRPTRFTTATPRCVASSTLTFSTPARATTTARSRDPAASTFSETGAKWTASTSASRTATSEPSTSVRARRKSAAGMKWSPTTSTFTLGPSAARSRSSRAPPRLLLAPCDKRPVMLGRAVSQRDEVAVGIVEALPLPRVRLIGATESHELGCLVEPVGAPGGHERGDERALGAGLSVGQGDDADPGGIGDQLAPQLACRAAARDADLLRPHRARLEAVPDNQAQPLEHRARHARAIVVERHADQRAARGGIAERRPLARGGEVREERGSGGGGVGRLREAGELRRLVEGEQLARPVDHLSACQRGVGACPPVRHPRAQGHPHRRAAPGGGGG